MITQIQKARWNITRKKNPQYPCSRECGIIICRRDVVKNVRTSTCSTDCVQVEHHSSGQTLKFGSSGWSNGGELCKLYAELYSPGTGHLWARIWPWWRSRMRGCGSRGASLGPGHSGTQQSPVMWSRISLPGSERLSRAVKNLKISTKKFCLVTWTEGMSELACMYNSAFLSTKVRVGRWHQYRWSAVEGKTSQKSYPARWWSGAASAESGSSTRCAAGEKRRNIRRKPFRTPTSPWTPAREISKFEHEKQSSDVPCN